jgi:25S rRNA (uracil2843-N3)-methyltransferase
MPGKQKKGSNKRADRDLLNNKAPSKSSARQAQEAAAAAAAAREQQQQQAKSAAPSAEELASQQKLLSIFQSAYSEVLSSPDFSSTLQEVKAALYEREFERAFAKEEYLDVYAARWSPTRALGYAAVLEGLREWLNGLLLEEHGATAWGTPAAAVEAEVNEETAGKMGDLSLGDESTKAGDPEDTEAAAVPESKEHQDGNDEDEEVTDSEQQDTTTTTTTTHKTLKVLALGGGTAELAALVSFLSKSSPGVRGDLTLVDAGPWAGPVAKLHTALTVPPPIYKYASAAAKAANKALADATTLRYDFLHRDALSLTAAELRDCVVPRDHQPVLVTLLFTLNELYTGGGIGKTTAFLRMLGRTLAPGSLLLVVDSPGSYSEAAVGGKEKKKYPMSWLVDHTLLRAASESGQQAARRKPQDQEGGAGADAGEEKSDKTPAQQEEGCKWEKLEENESIWFRISDELRYPIQLENMRYQLHLYRAISATETKK